MLSDDEMEQLPQKDLLEIVTRLGKLSYDGNRAWRFLTDKYRRQYLKAHPER